MKKMGKETYAYVALAVILLAGAGLFGATMLNNNADNAAIYGDANQIIICKTVAKDIDAEYSMIRVSGTDYLSTLAADADAGQLLERAGATAIFADANGRYNTILVNGLDGVSGLTVAELNMLQGKIAGVVGNSAPLYIVDGLVEQAELPTYVVGTTAYGAAIHPLYFFYIIPILVVN